MTTGTGAHAAVRAQPSIPAGCTEIPKTEVYLRLFGLQKSKPGAEVDIAEEKGLSIHEVKYFYHETGLTMEQAIELMGISARTMERREEEGILKPEEADKLLRIAKIFVNLQEIFSDKNFILRWWNTPLDDLGGKTPIQVARTETGRDRVMEVIGRIRSGAY